MEKSVGWVLDITLEFVFYRIGWVYADWVMYS
jgi:hypothetical protein